LLAAPNGTEAQDVPQAAEKSGARSDKWLTFGVIALILAGILLGAGIATFLIARFGAALRR
jgi:hypothetical protein